MIYLHDHIHTVKEQLHAKKRIILLTDYDGTLTPIREHPDLAVLSEEMRQMLRKFSDNEMFFLGIITGRSLRQIKKLVNIRNVLYAANHGIEIEGPDIQFTDPEAKKARDTLRHIYMNLLHSLRHIEGIYLEDKGLAISLHYRLVKNKNDMEHLTKTLMGITQPFQERKMLSVSTGKMVYEIRPSVQRNKSSTVQWLMNNYFPLDFTNDAILIYLGDDEADREVFTALHGKGLTIFVGNPADTSAADYFVHSPEEVKIFLEYLYEEKVSDSNESFKKSKRTVSI